MDALMDAARTLIPLALLFFLIDIPYLYATGAWAQSLFKAVQGGAPFQLRWAAAPIVYLALAYLLSLSTSTAQAAAIGAATYAVYDFTNYATLTKYDINFAVVDTAWGAALFSLVRIVGERLNLL
jgi:uncharacterized membrane protein